MAEVQRDSFAEALDRTVATKENIKDLRAEIKEIDLKLAARFERIEGKATLLQWMPALIIGGIASLILKTFFI